MSDNKIISSDYGHRFGNQVKCKLTGLVGYVVGMSNSIVGCQFLTLDCEALDKEGEKVGVKEFQLSTAFGEVISEGRQDQYEEMFRAKFIPNNFECGEKLKNIRTGEEGYCLEILYSSDGMCAMSMSSDYDPLSDVNKLGYTFVSAGYVVKVDDGIKGVVSENRRLRQSGELADLTIGDTARSIVDGCEGVIVCESHYANGTHHLGIQPKAQNNRKFLFEFYDIELLERVTGKDGEQLTSENIIPETLSGCINYPGAQNISKRC